MSKMQAGVEVAIASPINSPLCQKFSLKLKNKHKNSKKAFSVAEAMIALLIGSVALGMAAPMITKQIKSQNISDTQFRIINNRNQDLLERMNELEERIDELENADNTGIPRGTIAFFDSTVEAESATNPCPRGWELISQNWNGRFPRFAGSHRILSYDVNSKTLSETELDTIENLNVGQVQEDAIRDIEGNMLSTFNHEGEGALRGIDQFNGGWGYVQGYQPWMYISFIASRVVPTSAENRPKSVALLGCRRK